MEDVVGKGYGRDHAGCVIFQGDEAEQKGFTGEDAW